MRIAFNAQRLASQRFGVGRYVEYMLRYWSTMLSPDDQLDVYFRHRPDTSELADLSIGGNVRPIVRASRLSGLPWENIYLHAAARSADVLFCPAYSAPIGYRGRLVVATHSVNELHAASHSQWYRHTYGRLYRYAAQRADAVVVTSEGTRQQLSALYRVPLERISVVEQGADDAFVPISDPGILAATRQQLTGSDRPYILFVGKCSVRRNIPALIEAFAAVRRELRIPHALVLFGPNPHGLPLMEIAARAGVRDDVLQTDGRVDSHAALIPIYSAADVFVHPSEFEGWSMTTIEAMACGVPVIASDRGGLGELARGHAHMLDDPSPDTIAGALKRVLTDHLYRSELRALSLQRAQGLRWSVATRQTLDVVSRVARDRPLVP